MFDDPTYEEMDLWVQNDAQIDEDNSHFLLVDSIATQYFFGDVKTDGVLHEKCRIRVRSVVEK